MLWSTEQRSCAFPSQERRRKWCGQRGDLLRAPSLGQVSKELVILLLPQSWLLRRLEQLPDSRTPKTCRQVSRAAPGGHPTLPVSLRLRTGPNCRLHRPAPGGGLSISWRELAIFLYGPWTGYPVSAEAGQSLGSWVLASCHAAMPGYLGTSSGV